MIGGFNKQMKWEKDRTTRKISVPFNTIAHTTVHIYLAQFSISPN